MIGERTGNVFRIVTKLQFAFINVNKDERAIDFEIVGMKGTPRRKFKDRPVRYSNSKNRQKENSRWT